MNIKSRGRRDAVYSMFNLAEDMLAVVDGIQQSCISCVHFDEQKEICDKFQQRPPARVIALGCPEYFDTNEIPF